MNFTFIHVADLHLDAVLPPFAAAGASEALLREAPFLALRRLVELCIESRAAFLLLAGDVYDSRGGSLKARLELRDACERLREHNIEVFWARGNHDPAPANSAGPSGLADAVQWPDNLKIFPVEGQSFFSRPGLRIHGISHDGPRVSENLALKLRAVSDAAGAAGNGPARFQIGVLHCALAGGSNTDEGAHENYAPCALADLTSSGFDYWALGHIHQPVALAQNPHVAYSGSLQGLHVKESGPRGCLVARVENGRLKSVDFQPLAPVRWERLELDVSRLGRAADSWNGGSGEHGEPDAPATLDGDAELPVSLDLLEEFILDELQEAVTTRLGGSLEPGFGSPRAVVFRVELGGRTPLDSLLRLENSLEDLAARLNGKLERRFSGGDNRPAVRIKDLKLRTRPDLDLATLLAGDNLLAETLRRALEFRDLPVEEHAPDSLSFLDSLYRHPAVRSLEKSHGLSAGDFLRFPRLFEEELPALAEEAAALCLDLFEPEE